MFSIFDYILLSFSNTLIFQISSFIGISLMQFLALLHYLSLFRADIACLIYRISCLLAIFASYLFHYEAIGFIIKKLKVQMQVGVVLSQFKCVVCGFMSLCLILHARGLLFCSSKSRFLDQYVFFNCNLFHWTQV